MVSNQPKQNPFTVSCHTNVGVKWPPGDDNSLNSPKHVVVPRSPAPGSPGGIEQQPRKVAKSPASAAPTLPPPVRPRPSRAGPSKTRLDTGAVLNGANPRRPPHVRHHSTPVSVRPPAHTFEELVNERSYLQASHRDQVARSFRLMQQLAVAEERLLTGDLPADERRATKKKAGHLRSKIADTENQERNILGRLTEIWVELQSRERWSAVQQQRQLVGLLSPTVHQYQYHDYHYHHHQGYDESFGQSLVSMTPTSSASAVSMTPRLMGAPTPAPTPLSAISPEFVPWRQQSGTPHDVSSLETIPGSRRGSAGHEASDETKDWGSGEADETITPVKSQSLVPATHDTSEEEGAGRETRSHKSHARPATADTSRFSPLGHRRMSLPSTITPWPETWAFPAEDSLRPREIA